MSTTDTPAEWNIKTLIEMWHAHLRIIISSGQSDLPFERLCFQAQTDPGYARILSSWSRMTGNERTRAWQQLLSFSERAKEEFLPICVRCGECCLKGGPTLSLEDRELVQSQQIPWSQLMTVRMGEPVHSNVTGEVFYLEEERIKIRETKGSKACALYDADSKACTIHHSKPAQCRAQACWDPALAHQQIAAPPLTRFQLFEGMEAILSLIEAHTQRSDFQELRAAFDSLSDPSGRKRDDIVHMLAFDEHVRDFAEEALRLPREVMDLIFGRPLTARLRLFGFQIQVDDNGTRMLSLAERME